jgi:hypothetical protein
MTRKIYIGDVNGNADSCLDKIKRTSEESLHFHIIRKSDLVKHELTKDADHDVFQFFVPFFNQYQGLALYVTDQFVSKFDVDKFFSTAVHQNLESIVYFAKHDAWLFNCDDPAIRMLTPDYINGTTTQQINNNISITVIQDI